MKIVENSIEVVSWTDTKGNINPVRFRIINEDESKAVVKTDKVICVDKEKLTCNNMLVFKCQSVISGTEKLYEIGLDKPAGRYYLKFSLYNMDNNTAPRGNPVLFC